MAVILTLNLYIFIVRSASAHNNSKLRAHLKGLNPTLSSGGASLEEGKMKSEVDDVDAETAGSQFTLFPMDPSKRRKLYEYVSMQ